MSFAGLQERLSALQDTTTQLAELIDRLANIQFEPGSVPLDTSEENSVSGELSAEIGQLIRDGEDEAELLLEEVQYARPDGHEKTRLQDGVEKAGTEIQRCRIYFRKARLNARKSLTQAQQLEREILLKSYSQPVVDDGEPAAEEPERAPRTYATRQLYGQQQSSLSEKDQQTVGASHNVTSALRQTHDLIAAELARSEFAHQTLTESSATLKQLNESYSSLDDMLSTSRDLLGTLLKSQKSDTWYLQTTLILLLATAGWLVYRRLLYGPMWWLVWLPLRVVFGVGSKAGSAVLSARDGGHKGQVEQGSAEPDRKISVDGLPREDLPTVEAGRPASQVSAGVDEAIKKVVDAVSDAEELGSLSEEEPLEAGGKKLSSTEGARAEVDDSRPRDEL